MPRGFVWAEYISDDGNTYALRVDADYAAVPARGWTAPAPAGTRVYPRGWKPRRVVGLDDAGHPRFAVVGTTSCSLWTGATSTFTIAGTDGLTHTCTVFQMRAERMKARP